MGSNKHFLLLIFFYKTGNNSIVRLFLSLIFIFCLPSYAQVINLLPGNSIQTAINNSADGDVINLSSGLYKGNIDFKGKAITIRGVGKDTVLKGDGSRAVVFFVTDEESDSVLENLRITGGVRGGAILIENASPKINGCWILSNKSIGAGSAIYLYGNNAFGNSASFTNNVIALNKTFSIIYADRAHAIYVENASPSFVNNTFIQNDRSAIYIKGNSNIRISNNIFAYNGFLSAPGNPKKRGRAIEFNNFSGLAQIDYNLFYKNRVSDFRVNNEDIGFANNVTSEKLVSNGVLATLISNVSGNPNFVNYTGFKNLRLKTTSLARNIGDPNSEYNDFDGTRNDVGASGGPIPNVNLN
jgi:parallel beta-helix repeat protein